MIEIHSQPPECWPILEKRFGKKWEPPIVITYAGKIHAPAGKVSLPLLIHELVHVEQQKHMPPEEYLTRYLEDVAFRKKVETAAYKAQVAFLAATIEDRDRLWCEKHLIRKNMMREYDGAFTYEEASDILNLS